MNSTTWPWIVGATTIAIAAILILGMPAAIHTKTVSRTNQSHLSQFTGLTAGIEYTAVNMPTSGGQFGSVSFQGAESGGSGSFSCSWNFGDGGTSNICSPTHTWLTTGKFSVSLQITDSGTHASTAMDTNVNAGYITGTNGGHAPVHHPSATSWGWVVNFPCGNPNIWCTPTLCSNCDWTNAGSFLLTLPTYTTSWGDGTANTAGNIAVHLYGTGSYLSNLDGLSGGLNYDLSNHIAN